MLKITVKNSQLLTTLSLEGKLSGPWVEELERQWNECSKGNGARFVIVDLGGVNFVDSQGKGLLGRMLRDGAELSNACLLTKYIVDEVKSECGRT